jgi:hypothetical protein
MKRAAPLLLFLASLFAPSTFAVYVSGSGFGQALIYPYYTVQSVDGNAFNTYISIVNAHAQPKALRVRVREGRNGREIAGFNLFLEARGMWAAAIVPFGDGAYLATPDSACTAPAFVVDGGMRFLAFSTDAFTGANDDRMGTGRDRLREGYVEVLEMASFDAAFLPSCDALRAGLTGSLAAPQGYLYGMLTLINVMNGMDFTENAVALANLAGSPYFRPANDPYPDFNATEVGKIATFTRNDKFYRIPMASGLAAVEAALVVQHINNELVLEAGTQSATDWVITMPTRRFHTSGSSSPWFNAAVEADNVIRMHGFLRTRSGTNASLVLGCGFLCPGGQYQVDMRAQWASNVLGFRATDTSASSSRNSAAGVTAALGSRNGWLVDLPMAPGGADLQLYFWNTQRSGYASVTLTASTTRIGDGAVLSETINLTGLPVVGFMARTFRNGTLACSSGNCQGNYGGSSAHRVRRVVNPANDF